MYGRERSSQTECISRVAILTVCHAEQPIPVLFLRLPLVLRIPPRAAWACENLSDLCNPWNVWDLCDLRDL